MQSTTSTTSCEEPQPGTWRESLQQKWATALAKTNQLMPMMVSWESIRRGMKTEDELRDAQLRAEFERAYGKEALGDEDVGHMVLGDMKTEYHTHQQSPKKSNRLFPIIAAVALTAAGMQWGIPLVNKLLEEDKTPDPPKTTPKDPDDVSTNLGIKLG